MRFLLILVILLTTSCSENPENNNSISEIDNLIDGGEYFCLSRSDIGRPFGTRIFSSASRRFSSCIYTGCFDRQYSWNETDSECVLKRISCDGDDSDALANDGYQVFNTSADTYDACNSCGQGFTIGPGGKCFLIGRGCPADNTKVQTMDTDTGKYSGACTAATPCSVTSSSDTGIDSHTNALSYSGFEDLKNCKVTSCDSLEEPTANGRQCEGGGSPIPLITAMTDFVTANTISINTIASNAVPGSTFWSETNSGTFSIQVSCQFTSGDGSFSAHIDLTEATIAGGKSQPEDLCKGVGSTGVGVVHATLGSSSNFSGVLSQQTITKTIPSVTIDPDKCYSVRMILESGSGGVHERPGLEGSEGNTAYSFGETSVLTGAAAPACDITLVP